jgi:hypothetical protein
LRLYNLCYYLCAPALQLPKQLYEVVIYFGKLYPLTTDLDLSVFASNEAETTVKPASYKVSSSV